MTASALLPNFYVNFYDWVFPAHEAQDLELRVQAWRGPATLSSQEMDCLFPTL